MQKREGDGSVIEGIGETTSGIVCAVLVSFLK